MSECAKALALGYRYVLLGVNSGGEAFARSLRREYGISLVLDPSPDQLDRADALVMFSQRGDLARNNPILYTLYPSGEAGRGRLPLALPEGIRDQVEANCDFEQLAAALYATGGLPLESLLGMRQTPAVSPACGQDFFFRTVRAAFAQRRKTLANSLSSVLGLGREMLVHQGGDIQLEDVPGDQGEAVRAGHGLRQHRQQGLVQLHGHHLTRQGA